jgi:hypothetical protein
MMTIHYFVITVILLLDLYRRELLVLLHKLNEPI